MRRALLLSGIQVYPTESGGQMRAALVARKLVDEGYEVLVYSMTGRKKEYLAGAGSGAVDCAPGIREYVHRGKLHGLLQLLCYRLGLPPFWLLLARAPKEMESADCVVIDQPYLFRAWRRTGGRKVLNTHNAEYLLFAGWRRRLVERIERAAVAAADEVWCCSEAERAIFSGMGGGVRVVVVPNHAERIARPAAARRRVRDALGLPETARVLLFAASRYAPNLEALDFLARFAATHESSLARLDVYLLVAGTVAPAPRRVGRLIVTGPVETIEDYFSAADIALNPVVSGAGTSVKMLQYGAAGLPILSTEFGARGLGLSGGTDYVAFTPENLHEVLRDYLQA